jgi:hypothetical protein
LLALLALVVGLALRVGLALVVVNDDIELSVLRRIGKAAADPEPWGERRLFNPGSHSGVRD